MQQPTEREFFNMEEIEGDLFTYCSSSDWNESVLSHTKEIDFSDSSLPIKSMCHCVSVDLNMGAGIAVIFKKKYGCVSELKEQGAQIGQMATLFVPQENMFI